MRKIAIVNGNDRAWSKHRFILAFGAYGDTRLMVWADHLETALDVAIDWIADNAPGLLADAAVNEAFKEAKDQGLSDDQAMDQATIDTTCGGNCGNYLNSWEWCIVAEDPSRGEILAMQGRE